MCEGYNVCTEEQLKARLCDYVNTDTPSGDREAINRLNVKIEKELLSLGASVLQHESKGGDMLEARIGKGKKQILFLGHMDTVFPLGEAAKRPFSEENGILHGPGVLDMKSGLCMIIEIFRHFAGKLPEEFSLCACFNADEEVGSSYSEELIRRLCRESVCCICMEPSKPGYCTVARKGLSAFMIKVRGVSAHSGVNYLKGHSAIEEICRMITEIYRLRDDEKSVSVNIGGISGGTGKFNIVADYAEAKGEMRCFDPETAKAVMAKITDICSSTKTEGTTSEFIYYGARPPMKQSEASRLVYESARQAAEKHGLQLTSRAHGGGSDGSFASDEGIPVLDGMGAEGENSHTDSEYVLADTIMKRLYTVIDTVNDIIKGVSVK